MKYDIDIVTYRSQIYSIVYFRRLFKSFILLALLTLVASGCSDDKEITYLRGDMKNVFRLAKKNKKKVFVLITAGGCGKCDGFESLLDQQKKTVRILGEEYICYKVNIENPKERELAQIVKCPSYPFPYFFKSDGTLLAFGFPNSSNYDVSDLTKISIEQYRFSELFNLNIKTNAYKELVSINMKATLLDNYSSDSTASKVFSLYKKSLSIAAYPYNIKKFNTLSNQKQKKAMELKISSYSPTVSDRVLYGDLNTYMKMDSSMKSQIIVLKLKRTKDYILIDSLKDLGKLKKGIKYKFTFRLKNLSNIPLVINSVMHPCDCVKLTWPNTKILSYQSALIEGEFTPYESGEFQKAIFVHSTSVNNPMGIFTIKGVVCD